MQIPICMVDVDADVVVIRSHGVAKYIYDIMDERGITCVDATCPFVNIFSL